MASRTIPDEMSDGADLQGFRGTAFRRLQLVLSAGFGLLLLLLVWSAWLGIGAMNATETAAELLIDQQSATLHLIEDIQQEQDSLSEIFYSLAVDQSAGNRAASLEKLDRLESQIQATLRTGLTSQRPQHWAEVQSTVNAFVAEGRSVIHSGQRPGVAFFRNHEALIAALGKLTTVNFDAAAAAETQRSKVAGERVKSSLLLVGAALLTAIVIAFITVRVATRMFRRLGWQEVELERLSSRVMADQEATARRFSRELHDEFGQTLNAAEATLVSMSRSAQYSPERVEDALALIKSAIGNARELSQLLRPSILDDFGLDASLSWLAEGFAHRTGIKVDYVCPGITRPSSDVETQLFRIAQEALTNVSRHANATLVRMELEPVGGRLILTVTDNGQGFPETRTGSGLGLLGMRARSRAAAGKLSVNSAPGQGVTVRVEVNVGK